MNTLSIDEIQKLRLAVFDNASSLYKEAKLLFDNTFYSRAYLLAYFCAEELGKLPILIVVIGTLTEGEEVNWKEARKSFYNHKAKIGMQNGHFYAFARDGDLPDGTKLDWLLEANSKIKEAYDKKNISTYVDVIDNKVSLPSDKVSAEDAKDMLTYASACLRAHEVSESLTNPLIYMNEAGEDIAPSQCS